MDFIDTEIALRAGLIFLRIGALLFALPVFGDAAVPLMVKIMIAVSLTVGLYPLIDSSWGVGQSFDTLTLAVLILKEIILGLLLGYSARFLFEGVVMAASLVGYQMGFGTASLIAPGSGEQMSPFTALHHSLVVLLFLGLSFHHIFIHAILESFRVVPFGFAHVNSSMSQFLVEKTNSVFSIAIQFAAPILVALLFAMAALGLVARAVPQVNVFTLSFPISFFLGLVIYIAALPFFPAWLRAHYESVGRDLLQMLMLFRRA